MKLNDIVQSSEEDKELMCIQMASRLMKKSQDVEIWNIPDFVSNDEEDNDTTTDEEESKKKTKGEANEYSGTCAILNNKLKKSVKHRKVACMPVRKDPIFAEDFVKSEPSTQNETQVTEPEDAAEKWLLEKQAQIEAEISAGKNLQNPAPAEPELEVKPNA